MTKHCQYWGPDTGETIETGACCGLGVAAVHACHKAEGRRCVLAPLHAPAGDVVSCLTCPHQRSDATFPTVEPVAPPQTVVMPEGSPTAALNASITTTPDGRLLMAARDGWTSAALRVFYLGPDGKPRGKVAPVPILHAEAERAFEDPRLFWFRGRLYCSCTGFARHWTDPRGFRTSVLWVEIKPDLTAGRPVYADYNRRAPVEKNWVFFEHARDLWAIYQPGGPRASYLRFDSAESGKAVERIDAAGPGEDRYGDRRGGAAPFRVGPEMWALTHSVLWHPRPDGSLGALYTAGLYTFEPTPPFRPLRRLESPLIVAGRSSPTHAIVYPCGAVPMGDLLAVSYGEHDERSQVVLFPLADLERKLQPCRQPQPKPRPTCLQSADSPRPCNLTDGPAKGNAFASSALAKAEEPSSN